jgi:acetoin utilization deacetylase AcuC-like enzyme
MTTLVYDCDAFGAHETPQGHPERSARHGAVRQALADPRFDALLRREAPQADRAALLLAHGAHYVDAVWRAAPEAGLVGLDPDTTMGPHSLDAALCAAGAGVAAVAAVMAGEADNAFIAARPPGHHATPARAMGFCLFNSAAIAALSARARGVQRVAVVDFDVHHGNGTEAIFWDDENAFFASSHEYPQYPGTGRQTDRGAFGNIANAPLPTGTAGEGFRRAWGEHLLPALSEFGPDFIVISAGFDGHRADPLGGLSLVEADFAWATREILAVARASCGGRVVSLLEGGYDLAALGGSVAAHVGALMGDA